MEILSLGFWGLGIPEFGFVGFGDSRACFFFGFGVFDFRVIEFGVFEVGVFLFGVVGFGVLSSEFLSSGLLSLEFSGFENSGLFGFLSSGLWSSVEHFLVRCFSGL